jgi:hypothetical protein
MRQRGKTSRRRKVPYVPSRRPVSISTVWGNNDAEATLKVTRSQWNRIIAGAEFAATTWAWYEGKRERVTFRFNSPQCGDLRVDGVEGAEYFLKGINDAIVTGADAGPSSTNSG